MLTEEHDERDPTTIDIERDIPEEIRSPIFSPSTSAAEFMSPILPNFKRSYHATPYQLEICTRLLPAADEQDNLPTQSSSDYIISQAYVLSQSLLLLNVQNIINKLCYEYPILTTTVYRNPKIIDADIECYLEYTPWEDIPKERFTEVIKLEDSKNAEKAIWETAQEWITKRKIDETFKLLIIECPATSQSYFIFSASLIIMDEISLLWLSKKFFSLYDASVQGSDLSNYNCEEQDTFEDLTYNTVRLKSDISFWRDQCIQVSQDSINFEEKKTLEVQLRMLEKERVTLKTALQSATKQRAEYEKSLTNLRKQRLAIDQDNTGKGAKSSFTDPTTGEVCIISKTTKDALIKTVLGDEAVGENVIPLLAKHDVSKEIQRKINAASLNLENFAAITEMTIDNLYLENRDHRKILALIDYVRNRIKECIQEQGKVKFVLEREIAKSSRGFEASSNKVKISRDNLEANEDLAFRLNNILHPPYIENIIECLSLKNLYDTFTDPTTVNLNRWGFQSFNISGEMLDNLRKFRSDWTLNIRNKKRLAKKKAFLDQSSDNDSLLEDDNDEDEKDKNQRRLLEHSVDAVCLAAFGVLMKHISGINQFTIGVNCSFRTPGLILGPLTDILPVKIDLTKKGISFTALFASLYKVFKQIRRHGPGCPFGYISKTLKIPAEFPIQFEFISLAEKRDWQALGFSVADLISPHERTALHFANLKAERVWTTNQQTNYDMKFIMVECEDTIECGVRYRSDRFEQEKILKWITKYQSTLEGIDCSRRKISVSSMISR
ncbi:hypothetical protein BC833DRAFT_61906 [Globomyces pollinis-pini]|nr:hypothetical protein BC833DRAFT_61906 [Globomyces pollinis-pini]